MVHQVFGEAAIQQVTHASPAMCSQGDHMSADCLREMQDAALLVFMIKHVDRVVLEHESLGELL